jgi:hypothetical protein
VKIPYFLQGAFFAPACAALIFALKITCPAPSGVGCFADPFISSVFMPLPFIYRVFGEYHSLAAHEPLFILGYWLVIGLVAGLTLDLYIAQSRY